MFGKTINGKQTFGILGLGRFGTALAKELSSAGADIVVVDRDEERVRELREYTENAFVVKGLDKKTLIDTGMREVDVAIVCISEHLDTSILTTLQLVSLGVPTVIAKASSQEHGEILEKLGAEVVYPERDMGVRLAHRLGAPKTLDYIQLSEKLNISKQRVSAKLVGKSVLDSHLRREFGINIIAIEKGDGTLMEVVRPDYVFETDDILFISGSNQDLARYTEWAG